MQYEPFGAYIYGMGVEEDQIERACASRGWIFWDADSFERENLICYAADCSDRGYGRKDFLELAGGDEELAREIFFRCMGQTPQECLREIEQERRMKQWEENIRRPLRPAASSGNGPSRSGLM